MRSRIFPAIELRPSNEKGGHYSFNILKNKIIHSYIWSEVSISERAIKRVHEIAKE